jgi:hypothetical protein
MAAGDIQRVPHACGSSRRRFIRHARARLDQPNLRHIARAFALRD